MKSLITKVRKIKQNVSFWKTKIYSQGINSSISLFHYTNYKGKTVNFIFLILGCILAFTASCGEGIEFLKIGAVLLKVAVNTKHNK